VARAAAQRGAEVTLVTGPTQCAVPLGVKAVHVKSAEQMRGSVIEALPAVTAVVMTAAVSDFRPVEKASQKVKKSGASLRLELEETPDILRELGTRKEKRILIGFAAETESLVQNAVDKLARKNLDLIVVNDVSCGEIGFQSDRNQVKILGKNGEISELPIMTKDELAHEILDHLPALRRLERNRRKPGAGET
jgi:phosphopantothenoylcysteine decarboxylase/phosphopantothenate--cysteine ligase